MAWLRRFASIAAMFAICFLAIEYVVRTRLLPASKDLSRLEPYASRAKELGRQKGVRIAIIGNSATEHGVDPRTFQQRLQTLGVSPVAADVFPVDGANVVDCYYVLNHYFWRDGIKPDLIILLFHFSNLLSEESGDVGRLAHYLTKLDDWPDVFGQELAPSWQVNFLLSTNWSSYAVRDRVRNRLLGTFMPYYESFSDTLSAEARERRSRRSSGGPSGETRPCRALERLLVRARREGTPILFVAFPARDTRYPLFDRELALIRQAGMTFVDMRSVDGVKPEMYRDSIHMLEPGKQLFSRRLADRLADDVRKLKTAEAAKSRSAAPGPGKT